MSLSYLLYFRCRGCFWTQDVLTSIYEQRGSLSTFQGAAWLVLLSVTEGGCWPWIISPFTLIVSAVCSYNSVLYRFTTLATHLWVDIHCLWTRVALTHCTNAPWHS